MTERQYDIAIIGGGPAGLSAAIWSARYLHSVCVIDSGDPRNWETRGINGFLGHPSIRPAQLRGKGRDEARECGVTFVDALCERVACHEEDHFELTLGDGKSLHARRLLLAIGLRTSGRTCRDWSVCMEAPPTSVPTATGTTVAI
jgi:thioredoxin reductase